MLEASPFADRDQPALDFWGWLLHVLLAKLSLAVMCFSSPHCEIWIAVFLKRFYWSTVDLQFCVSFRGTAKWFFLPFFFSPDSFGLVVKNLPANAGATGDSGSIPGLGRSPGGGNGIPLQHSCLGNPMERGAWRATAHEVAKSWTWLQDLDKTESLNMHARNYKVLSIFPFAIQ